MMHRDTARALAGHRAGRGKVLMHDGARHINSWGPLYPAALIKSGTAAVATDVFVPGLLIVEPGVITKLGVTVRTAPTGAGLIVSFYHLRTSTVIDTVTVAASATSGSTSVDGFAVLEGDLIRTDITQVGSTVAGADVVAWVREVA